MFESSDIYSELAIDPEMRELVASFVERLPQRLSGVQRALDDQDVVALSALAHQLKGASGSYGFHEITPVAGDLERAADANLPEEELALRVAELIEICARARSDAPRTS